MSSAFFPRSRVTTTAGGAGEHATTLPVPDAAARSRRAGWGRKVPEGGEKGASEENLEGHGVMGQAAALAG